jgi:hypothetical protein
VLGPQLQRDALGGLPLSPLIAVPVHAPVVAARSVRVRTVPAVMGR